MHQEFSESSSAWEQRGFNQSEFNKENKKMSPLSSHMNVGTNPSGKWLGTITSASNLYHSSKNGTKQTE